MIIYCIGCEQDVEARLTNGAERYPHRPDLADVPQYTHDVCGSWVGTHHKSSNRLKPLGVELGYQYHTGELRTIDEAKKVFHMAEKLKEKVLDAIDKKEYN